MKSSRAAWCLAVPLLVVSSSAWAGVFVPVYSEVSEPVFREWQQELRADRVLESLAGYLNENLILPTDVTITVTECDTSNAFYNSKEQAIIICWELIADFYEGALELGWSEELAEKAAENATAFFFYHELGHALIHVLDLPTTGREEDSVDQLSTYVLAYESEGGEVPTLDAALAFLAWSQEAKGSQAAAPFWDEHSLNEQRFFNLVCWVYGQDPGRFQNLVQQGLLPESRAARCPGEWQQIDKSWTVLLEPHLTGE